jgi:hypothetical protein
MRLDRLEMRAACDDADFMTGGRQAYGEITADGASPVDTDFHLETPWT